MSHSKPSDQSLEPHLTVHSATQKWTVQIIFRVWCSADERAFVRSSFLFHGFGLQASWRLELYVCDGRRFIVNNNHGEFLSVCYIVFFRLYEAFCVCSRFQWC